MGPYLWRVVKWGGVLLLVALGAGAVTARVLLLGSLPVVTGSVAAPGLSHEALVRRDGRGVPLIRTEADDFRPVAFAQGFVHAQDRFFQMDGMRRQAAGELAALVGASALPADRAARLHRFRAVSRALLDRLPLRHRQWLESYTDGVNRGLAALASRPPEYLALGVRPEPWRPEDSLLVMFCMYDNLSFGYRFEWRYDAIASVLGVDVAGFLMPETTRFDAPIVPDAEPAYAPAPVPALPALGASVAHAPGDAAPPLLPLGSNNWAVSGRKTADGRAILANDMHLRLMVPNTWHHAQLEWGGPGGRRRAVGVCLPGVPGITAGSNGRVAWGFTNLTADCEDYIEVEIDPRNPSRYRFGPGPDDFEEFGLIAEEIAVRGRPSELLAIRSTRWGAVHRTRKDGTPLVLKWPALDAATVNINLFDMMNAADVDGALAVARSWWGPPQNVMIAGADGRIAWTVSGWFPMRDGFDGRTPVNWAREGAGWSGPAPEELIPRLSDPEDGVLFTANARPAPLHEARLLGRNWSSGDRAGRIGALLRAGGPFAEADMLRIQLDTRTEALDATRALILEIVPPDEPDPALRAARAAVESWNGRADADQVGLGVIDRFERAFRSAVSASVAARVRRAEPDFTYFSFQDREPLLRLAEERPDSWLPPGHGDWRAFLRSCVPVSTGETGHRGGPLFGSWGSVNRAQIQHPIAAYAPIIRSRLNMPEHEQPGHPSAVRVAGRSFGASQRLVVSPGREEDGILHMPGGQSGHPMSPHYRDGHDAWAAGEPRPLLAGEPVSTLRLLPAASGVGSSRR